MGSYESVRTLTRFWFRGLVCGRQKCFSPAKLTSSVCAQSAMVFCIYKFAGIFEVGTIQLQWPLEFTDINWQQENTICRLSSIRPRRSRKTFNHNGWGWNSGPRNHETNKEYPRNLILQKIQSTEVQVDRERQTSQQTKNGKIQATNLNKLCFYIIVTELLNIQVVKIETTLAILTSEVS